MSQTVCLTALLFILYNSIPVKGLECISCQDVVDERMCTSTQTCSQGQSCYKMTHEVNNTLVITEGCIDNKQCGVNVGSIIGRGVSYFGRRQSQNCKECCASDQCNRDLCRHTKPSTCLDDETMDCPKLNSIFNICNDIQHAKNVCPNFCGLCSVVDGQWSSWSDWTQCTITCNNGTISRDRTCSNPAPSSGGLNCTGESRQTKECFTATPCPVDGNWSDWGQWESCSTSCEAGIQTRARTCTNPKPDNQGDHCFGPNVDARSCDNGPCRDGGWSAWSVWSDCSSTNGTGIKTQSRTCTNPKPSSHGSYCVGNSMRVDICYIPLIVYVDCSNIKENEPNAKDGIYTVSLWKSRRQVQVYCDMTTDGGGWTVFQRRLNGAVDFYRNFTEYENGFGDLNTEFWLGLSTIQEMSSHNINELRIDLTAKNGSTGFEVLENFSLSPGPNYTLHVGKTSKSHNIGSSDRFGPGHNGMAFSTFDRDMDENSDNCASTWHGAWWYKNCYSADLNGKYNTFIIYHSFIFNEPLQTSRMAFRRARR